MGALTKGDRRAADASDLSNFDVDTKWGRAAMSVVVELLMHPGHHAQNPPNKHVRECLGLALNAELQTKWQEYLDEGQESLVECGVGEKDADKLTTKIFLNRILGLPVERQNRIFSHFAAELDEQVKKAKEEDKFDEGVVDIRGESLSIASGYPQCLATDTQSGVALNFHLIEVDRGISFQKGTALLDEKATKNPEGELLRAEGWYRSAKPMIGREKEANPLHGHAILIQKPPRAFALNPVPVFKLYRPSTGLGKDTSLREFTAEGRCAPPFGAPTWPAASRV